MEKKSEGELTVSVNKIKASLSSMKVFVNAGEENFPKALIEWQAPEFYLVDKSVGWGIFVGLVGLANASLLIFLRQYTLALICLLFIFVVLKFAYAKPQKIKYRIEEEGVRISGWLHRYYTDITGFWTARHGNGYTLYLESKNILVSYLTVPTSDIPLKKIVKILEKYLPEKMPAQAPRVKVAKRA